MKETHKIKVGISVGDLNGIGCEIILKTFADTRMLDFCTPILFASNKTMSQQKNALGLQVNFQGVRKASEAVARKVNIVNVWKEVPLLAFGEATEAAGRYAIMSLKAAVAALKEGSIDVLVTAPINKNNIQAEDFKFPGHTDFLAQELQGESLMFMVSGDLRIGLLTDHIPIKDVANAITPQLVRNKVALMEQSLKMDFRIRKPKIALLGINPHCGDNGIIGKEDDVVLRPVIQELFNQGTLVYGPYSADSFFGSDAHTTFDGILAAYHDQGLVPFKTLSFGQGVNYTAGLSKVRTSPDHGTAYGIAGKGKADARSFKEAVFTAIQVYRNRLEYQKINKNPLQKRKNKKTG